MQLLLLLALKVGFVHFVKHRTRWRRLTRAVSINNYSRCRRRLRDNYYGNVIIIIIIPTLYRTGLELSGSLVRCTLAAILINPTA